MSYLRSLACNTSGTKLLTLKRRFSVRITTCTYRRVFFDIRSYRAHKKRKLILSPAWQRRVLSSICTNHKAGVCVSDVIDKRRTARITPLRQRLSIFVRTKQNVSRNMLLFFRVIPCCHFSLEMVRVYAAMILGDTNVECFCGGPSARPNEQHKRNSKA